VAILRKLQKHGGPQEAFRFASLAGAWMELRFVFFEIVDNIRSAMPQFWLGTLACLFVGCFF
jgi:hypothetical protein